MDYSAISHDPDHPTGSSPWDSPGADRTTFTSSQNNDVPSSPLPPQDHLEDPERVPESPQLPQSTESTDPRSTISDQLQNTQLDDSDQRAGQSPYGVQPSPPTRYHQGARQQAKPAPVYKIQGKITALERTGKKDPVLRFDVHVSIAVECRYWLTRSDECSQVSDDSVSRCAPDSLRICQAG